jgi:signal transduction histidine kinase
MNISSPAAAAPSDPLFVGWRRVRLDRLATISVGLLLGFAVAVVAFVVTVTLAALAIGLLIVYPLALPVVVAWTTTVRATGAAERARVRGLLGVTIAAPVPPASVEGWHRRLWRAALHRSTMRAFAYHLLRLPLAILVFTFTLLVWLGPAYLLLAVPAQLLLTGADLAVATATVLGLGGVVAGAALALLIPSAIVALADLEASVAAALLGISARDRLDDRLEHLASTRSEMVDLAESERRRIERDLHDGAGQQLVSLAMTLGMAKEKLATAPEDAKGLIDEAHDEAKRALSDLRDLVRGISPAILNDRGLGAALSAVTARSTIPVTLVVDVPDRLDPAVEGIAYFVVCEAMSNATRHAAASRLHVEVRQEATTLQVEVTDDGRGGADAARGTGLRGLAGRVAAVDGTFEVTSPPGGPTVVRAVLPIDVDALATDRT